MKISNLTTVLEILMQQGDILAITDSTATRAGSAEVSVAAQLNYSDTFTDNNGNEVVISGTHQAEPHMRLEYNEDVGFSEGWLKDAYLEGAPITVKLESFSISDTSIRGKVVNAFTED